MPIKIDLEQNTPEWLEFRASHIGASDAPIILGLSPWKTAEKLFIEKLNPPIARKPTKSQQFGHEMEEEARCYFEMECGKLFPPATLVHSDHQWISASLDGLSIDGKEVLEIKNVNLKDHQTALEGNIPIKYYWQCVQQLFVSGADRLYYLSYQRDNPTVVVLEPRNSEFLVLFENLLSFYNRLIEAGFNGITA